MVLAVSVDIRQTRDGFGIRRVGQYRLLEIFGCQPEVADGGVFLAQQHVNLEIIVIVRVCGQETFDRVFRILDGGKVHPFGYQVFRIAAGQNFKPV